ncbi:hypothetical protein LJR084_005906 [Variovorax sp. LjRoot84]|uniref:hypothetical protein n=1 Tax=Variovorax sp. LjRoot84 TaxID=3342340 RepID=UPI003ECD00AB
MKKLVSMLLVAMALGTVAGCASRAVADGDRSATTGGSGITVFGTIDAAVSGSRNR